VNKKFIARSVRIANLSENL